MAIAKTATRDLTTAIAGEIWKRIKEADEDARADIEIDPAAREERNWLNQAANKYSQRELFDNRIARLRTKSHQFHNLAFHEFLLIFSGW